MKPFTFFRAVLHLSLVSFLSTIFPPSAFAQSPNLELQPAKDQIILEPIHEYPLPQPIIISPTKLQCITTGCSGELCVDAATGPLSSTCQWHEEYTCYQQATCEVQSNGTCGWTMSPELSACLNDHQPQPLPQLTAIPLPQPQPTFISQPYPTLLPNLTPQPKPIEICTLYCPEGTILTPECRCDPDSGYLQPTPPNLPVITPNHTISPAPPPSLNPHQRLLTFRLRVHQFLHRLYLRFSLSH